MNLLFINDNYIIIQIDQGKFPDSVIMIFQLPLFTYLVCSWKRPSGASIWKCEEEVQEDNSKRPPQGKVNYLN